VNMVAPFRWIDVCLIPGDVPAQRGIANRRTPYRYHATHLLMIELMTAFPEVCRSAGAT
jgi:hypothetical protein